MNEAAGDEEERVHDQLPTVQEIHAFPNQNLDETRRRKKKCILVSVIIALCVSISVAVPVFISAKSSYGPSMDERKKLVLDFLGTVSSSSDLQKDGSPQQLACAWISLDDPRQLAVPSGINDSRALSFISRYVAAVLYFSSGGSNWSDNFHFLSENNICDWNKFTDGASEYALFSLGIVCNKNDEPQQIMIPSNNLIGTIPTEIGLLTSLIILGFPSNKLSGILPSQMENLSNLKGLIFYTNELSGPIPSWLGSLSNLEWLSMPNNKFSGSIPEEIGSLSRLKLLNFQINFNIVGIIPDTLQKLTSLELIYLSYNNLEGSIPSWIGDLANLTDLRLSNNNLSSSIPNSLSNADKLSSLYLDDNDLTGDLSAVESLSNLEVLLVEDNNIEQSLDSNFLASLDKLRVLDASNNKLKGSLPSSLFRMDELKLLDLHGNKIEGNLPNIPVNNMLEFLSLYENNMVGSIPLSISNAKNLTHLDLSTNKLTGPIPASIGDMPALTYLFLATNSFDEGPIPEYLQKLSNLREISLKGTSRSGTIPDWISGLKDIILLDLGNNDLIETIPMAMGDLNELKFLVLNHNKLVGTVPVEINRLSGLQVLLIDDNDISALERNFCNNITGNLGTKGSVFIADCGGVSPQIECPCCTECCEDGKMCNNGTDFLANHDLIWEFGYNRLRYEFTDDIIFMVQPNGIP